MVRQALLSGPDWIKLARFMQAITLTVLAMFIWLLLTTNQPASQVPLTNVFWNILIPLVPILLLVGPGLWRNICPLAILNTSGHRLRVMLFGTADHKISPKKKSVRLWLSRYGLYVGVAVLFLLVPARLVLFNTSACWLGGLLLFLAAMALVAGFLLPFKSGWCSAICPIYPLERTYGSSPFLLAENLLCETYTDGSSALACGGCTRNCFDLKLLAKQKNNTVLPKGKPSAAESLFMAILPGFVTAYLILDGSAIGATMADQLLLKVLVVYLTFVLLSLASGLIYTIVKTISIKQAGAETGFLNLNRVFILSAFNIYYLMAIPPFTATAGSLSGIPAIWLSILAAALYAGVALTSIAWFKRQSQARI